MLLLPAVLVRDYSYQSLQVHGWTVKVETFETKDATWPAMRAQIEDQLYRIGRVVPEEPLSKLRKITIWVHNDDPATPCAAFHPDAGWLKEHGSDPQMAHGVELANAKNFISWTHEQPWMLLHELSHGYHALFLPDGFKNKQIEKAWDDAMASKKYDSVMRYNGQTAKHYAENNPMEYFAECSEAYFGRNDFYPFINAELKQFDPESYQLMVSIWGLPASNP